MAERLELSLLTQPISAVQRVCGVIGAQGSNLGKKQSCFPNRSLIFLWSLIFQWQSYLPPVEVAFIEQFYSHQASGTLFYRQDLQGLTCRSPDFECWLPGLCCMPQLCSDPVAKGLMSATSLQCQDTPFQGRKTQNTDFKIFFLLLAMILISDSFNRM